MHTVCFSVFPNNYRSTWPIVYSQNLRDSDVTYLESYIHQFLRGDRRHSLYIKFVVFKSCVVVAGGGTLYITVAEWVFPLRSESRLKGAADYECAAD